MDRFSQTHRSTFSKASNLILNQDSFNKNSFSRDRQPGSGLATPGGYMSGAQYQMLKEAKVNDAISRELRSKREQIQKNEQLPSSKREQKSRMFDHSKTLLRKKDGVKNTLERHLEDEDRDQRQIKAEIDYSDRKSYYAPSVKQGKRSNSAGGSQLSRANVRSAFGGNNPRGERSVTQHSSKASVYSRPTTSAAMSVVSARSYFSETEKRNALPTESIVEGSDEEENESETNSEVDSQEEEEKLEGVENYTKEGQEDELVKAELEEEKKRIKAQRKKQRRQKKEAERKTREQEKKVPSEISVPLSQTYFLRNQIKTAGVQEPRKWKHGLGEKLKQKDYGDETARMDKINRRMNKEREKALVGQRLHKQNQLILSQARSQNTSLPSGQSQVTELRSQRSNKPHLVPKFSRSLRISSGIVRDEQTPDSYSIPMVSTSHSTYTNRVFENHKVDKLNFKRLNMFGAYVNAAFKGGVFHGAPTDSA